MRVSTLRSTTRNEDPSDSEDGYPVLTPSYEYDHFDCDCNCDGDDKLQQFSASGASTPSTFHGSPAPATPPTPTPHAPSSDPPPARITRSRVPTHATDATMPPTKAKAGEGGERVLRPRKRVGSPEPTAAGREGSFEPVQEEGASCCPSPPSRGRSRPPVRRGRSRSPGPRRSRSLSVIPTESMPPLTHPAPEDAAVRSLGLMQSARPGARPLCFNPEQLVRMREGHFYRPRPERKTDIKRNWRLLSLSEAIWNGLEETGCITKGKAWTCREGYNDTGEFVKPDLPYVMLTKLVIASSPRKMLTLNQIYQAIEERWPYFKKLGQTFPNSIRHNLSMNPAFVNIERPAHETGFCGGKGGYWRVSDDMTTTHRGRAKKKTRVIRDPRAAATFPAPRGRPKKSAAPLAPPQVQLCPPLGIELSPHAYPEHPYWYPLIHSYPPHLEPVYAMPLPGQFHPHPQHQAMPQPYLHQSQAHAPAHSHPGHFKYAPATQVVHSNHGNHVYPPQNSIPNLYASPTSQEQQRGMPLPWPSATSVHPGVPLGDHPHPRESVRPKSQSQMPTPPYDDSAGFRPPRAQKAQHLSVAAMLNPPHSPTAPITPVSVSPSPPHRA